MIFTDPETAVLQQALARMPTLSQVCVVTTNEVVRGRVTLMEDRLSPEHDSFLDQCFDVSEVSEMLQLSIEVRVFEQIAVSKVQAVRAHVQTAVLRREVADISAFHAESGSAGERGMSADETAINRHTATCAELPDVKLLSV